MAESGIRQKSALSSSATVPSPQMNSQASRSTSERQNIWEHRLGIRAPEQNSEQKKYWEYRNIYHIPVPQGIEFWEDEDKKRWEMINIGGLDESEANRQIKKAKLQLARERQQENRGSRTPQTTNIFFIISLICFGLQIVLAAICIGFCIYQIFNNSQIEAGIAFLLLALMLLIGAAGGIFSALKRSENLAICTTVYNVTSAVGIIVAIINLYSFRVGQSGNLSAFIPIAGVVALVQTASFGVVLIIYFNLSSAQNYSRHISNAEMQQNRRRLYQKPMEMKARGKRERELNMKTEDVTRKYKQYLQKKGQIAGKSDKEGVRGEGSFEQQIAVPPESRQVKDEPLQDNSDSKNNSASPAEEAEQYRETTGDLWHE
ncbi:putative integral membrane protein [Brugia pahangi]